MQQKKEQESTPRNIRTKENKSVYNEFEKWLREQWEIRNAPITEEEIPAAEKKKVLKQAADMGTKQADDNEKLPDKKRIRAAAHHKGVMDLVRKYSGKGDPKFISNILGAWGKAYRERFNHHADEELKRKGIFDEYTDNPNADYLAENAGAEMKGTLEMEAGEDLGMPWRPGDKIGKKGIALDANAVLATDRLPIIYVVKQFRDNQVTRIALSKKAVRELKKHL